MLNLESIAVNVELENNGAYIDIPEWEGVKLGVRSLECAEYRAALDSSVEKLARKYQGRPVPPKERERIVGMLLAKHILFGWQGITPEYSPEAADDFLGSDKGRELATKVVWAASQVSRVEPVFE